MIILLNGTSSAGKTSIAKILQEKYDDVLLLYGVDTMVQAVFPEKCDYPPFDEKGIKLTISEEHGETIATLKLSAYMIPVYESAVKYYKLLSEQGYHLIVDEVLFDSRRIRPYFQLLANETVYFFGIKPEKSVVVQREKARGNRLIGLAAGLYDEVYNNKFVYDLTVDTGRQNVEASAGLILDYIKNEPAPQAFRRSAKNWL